MVRSSSCVSQEDPDKARWMVRHPLASSADVLMRAKHEVGVESRIQVSMLVKQQQVKFMNCRILWIRWFWGCWRDAGWFYWSQLRWCLQLGVEWRWQIREVWNNGASKWDYDVRQSREHKAFQHLVSMAEHEKLLKEPKRSGWLPTFKREITTSSFHLAEISKLAVDSFLSWWTDDILTNLHRRKRGDGVV